jgi:hypothetical protein
VRVDGREITVSGSLLQPLTRRTSDILRLLLAAMFLGLVITSSLITRYDWVSLERSISDIVGVLTPTQSNLVYLAYGIAILALPFAILIGLIAGRHWKLLGAYAAAGVIALLALSIRPGGFAAPQWHWDLADQPKTFLSQFLDDPRCPARGCLHGGGTGGGRCCWPSCPSIWSSAPWCPPARCSGSRWGGSLVHW